MTPACTQAPTHAHTNTSLIFLVCTSFSYLEKISKVHFEKSALNEFLALFSKEETLSDSSISLLSRLLLTIQSRTDA